MACVLNQKGQKASHGAYAKFHMFASCSPGAVEDLQKNLNNLYSTWHVLRPWRTRKSMKETINTVGLYSQKEGILQSLTGIIDPSNRAQYKKN